MRILSREESKKVRDNLVPEFLSTPTEFRIDALQTRGWIAVPMEERISDAQAEAIARAASVLSSKTAVGVTTEPQVDPEALELSLTAEDIHFFDAHIMLRAFLLIPDTKEFAILEQGDFFYVIAGPAKFMEVAIGGSIASARTEFLRYANAPHWAADRRQSLVAVHDLYSY